ncbi:hypothetical protein O9K51_03269 [Purpureocillium lavendulum]|uniref:Uncharacterized protein n=1 Tax=Purpureocillium lavendulum TaxID=1247861 RepID=A0AB34G0F6_9HYPO|nr:hypothetical protein O9K51_03269 [Purpureocillium lavendulum]
MKPTYYSLAALPALAALTAASSWNQPLSPPPSVHDQKDAPQLIQHFTALLSLNRDIMKGWRSRMDLLSQAIRDDDGAAWYVHWMKDNMEVIGKNDRPVTRETLERIRETHKNDKPWEEANTKTEMLNAIMTEVSGLAGTIEDNEALIHQRMRWDDLKAICEGQVFPDANNSDCKEEQKRARGSSQTA